MEKTKRTIRQPATIPIPERLNQLEEEVARLKVSYASEQRGIPEDDPTLIEAIVRDVRRVRKQLTRELYGPKPKTTSRLR